MLRFLWNLMKKVAYAIDSFFTSGSKKRASDHFFEGQGPRSKHEISRQHIKSRYN